MKLGVRLFPAVAGAATALLLLKAVSLLDGPSADTTASAGRDGGLASMGTGFFAVRSGSAPDPEATGSTAPPKKEEKKDDKRPPPPAGSPVNLDTAPVSPAEKALLEKLGQRREQLEERQREIETRENLLKAADKKLEGRINELKELETRTGTITPGGESGGPGGPGAPNGAGGNNAVSPAIRNLVTMYETMKPKEAARVFDKLELPVLVPVVNAMNPKKMAEILAAMSPEAAGKLTVELSKGNRGGGGGGGGRDVSLPVGELPSIDPRKP
jgi:flagellar motility protein MotE (MotC chaperone)